jgi:hypothetical protein
MDHEHRHRRIEALGRANAGWRVREDHAYFLLSQFAGKYWKERIVPSRRGLAKTSGWQSSPFGRWPYGCLATLTLRSLTLIARSGMRGRSAKPPR